MAGNWPSASFAPVGVECSRSRAPSWPSSPSPCPPRSWVTPVDRVRVVNVNVTSLELVVRRPSFTGENAIIPLPHVTDSARGRTSLPDAPAATTIPLPHAVRPPAAAIDTSSSCRYFRRRPSCHRHRSEGHEQRPLITCNQQMPAGRVHIGRRTPFARTLPCRSVRLHAGRRAPAQALALSRRRRRAGGRAPARR